MTAAQALADAETILLIDWPSQDVPETLARAGYATVVKGGPEPENYSEWHLRDGAIVTEKAIRPARVQIVYAHRPLSELPGIVALAKELGAVTVWLQSGLSDAGTRDPGGCWMPADDVRQARAIVEEAGLTYVDMPYIGDAVRELGSNR